MQVGRTTDRFHLPGVSLLGGGADSLAAKLTSAFQPTAATPAKTGGAKTSGPARELLARYDFTNMSPREFSNLTEQLADSGAVSETDLKALSQMRLELDSNQVPADERIDLVEFFQQRLQQRQVELKEAQRKSGANPALAAEAGEHAREAQEHLDWIAKFLAMKSPASQEPLDALV
ncbi:MAG: hypothetical protein ACYC35_07390 [Pirellulales bacterium]